MADLCEPDSCAWSVPTVNMGSEDGICSRAERTDSMLCEDMSHKVELFYYSACVTRHCHPLAQVSVSDLGLVRVADWRPGTDVGV